MGSTTANRAYPFPQFSDAVSGIADYFEDLADAVDVDVEAIANAIYTPPICIVKWSGSGTFTIPNGGGIYSGWDTEVLDPLGWHDPASNPSRITPNINGMYECKANFQFVGNSTGRRAVAVRQNGSTINYGSTWAATTAGNVGGIQTVELQLNGSTDYIEAFMFQDSGGTLACGDATSSRLSAKLLYRL